MRHQSSRITAAFLQADARPIFCWPRSASTARSQVWLGLPNGRFQSGGSLQITAATARWWSSCGELWAICPKSRKRLSVTRWERGWHELAGKKESGIQASGWIPKYASTRLTQSVLLYGYETWSITKLWCSRIDAFDMWALREILRIA